MASSKSAKKPAKKKPSSTRAPRSSAASTKKSSETKPKLIEAAAASLETVAPEEATPASSSKKVFSGLHSWNKWLAVLHALQGAAILVLATTRTLPVTTNYLTVDPIGGATTGHPVLAAATHHLFDVNVAMLVAAFFFLSAVAHVVVATKYRSRYEADLKRGINEIRWIEYSASASLMLVAIGLISGVYDLSALLMIFALTLIMNFLGLAMETYNQGRSETNWLAYGIGCVAGIVPWVVFAVYLVSAHVYGSGATPTFVYWIYGSMFVFFASFAANMYMQYQKKGKWADYLYGERVYMVLSLVAKTALAWQIFAGTLRP